LGLYEADEDEAELKKKNRKIKENER